MNFHRRSVLKTMAGLTVGSLFPITHILYKNVKPTEMPYKISLAEWSFHKALWAKKMDHLEFAAKAGQMGFKGVEYVNQFFYDKAEDSSYLDKMNEIAAASGVTQVLIMVDNEGYLGDTDKMKREEAIKKHHRWIHAAQHLGCHSIRVNAFGVGSAEEVGDAAIDGLGRLSEYAQDYNMNVIVENHGSYSSNGKWLSNVMSQINMSNCGTLPDFGNFCMKREGGAMWGGTCIEEYDKYQGVKEMMPFAKAISAKSFAFDNEGNETTIDFDRMMSIVMEHGYNGFVGIEFEGEHMEEEAGILATKALLERIAKK